MTPSKYVQLCTIGIASHVNTLRGVAARLKKAGYRVGFLLQRPQQRSVLADLGWPVQLADGSERAVKSVESALSGLPDDAIVVADAEWHEVLLTSMGLGRAVAAVEYHCSPDRVPGVPPLSSPYTPRPNLLGRIRSALEWRRALARRTERGVVIRQLEGLRGLAERYGLDLERETRLDCWQPIRFRRLDYLCTGIEAFDFTTPGDRVSEFIGPNIDATRIQEQGEEAFEAWFGKVIEGRKNAPLVYASLGSLKTDPAWAAAIVDAARLTPDWNWLLSSADESVRNAASGPANLAILTTVPQLRVLEYADAALIGAGIATIYECISTGTPFVAYSLGVLDQNGNAARAAYHGLGEAVFGCEDRPEVMINRLEGLMDSAAVKDNLVQYRAHSRQYDETGALTLWMQRLRPFT